MAHTKPTLPRLQRGKRLANGLVAAWPVYEGGGTTLYDVSGRENHGVFTNAPTWTGGRNGHALSFNGSSNYITVTDDDSLDFGTGDFSFCCWLFAPSQVADRTIFGKRLNGAGAGQPGYNWFVDDATHGMRFVLDDGVSAIAINANTTIDNSTWYHVALVCERSANGTFYVDGRSDGATSISARSASISTSEDLLIGAINDNGTDQIFFNGSLADLRMYNRVLTQPEIALIAAGLG